MSGVKRYAELNGALWIHTEDHAYVANENARLVRENLEQLKVIRRIQDTAARNISIADSQATRINELVAALQEAHQLNETQAGTIRDYEAQVAALRAERVRYPCVLEFHEGLPRGTKIQVDLLP